MFLLLGSNIGDRIRNLEEAREKIGSIIHASSIYVTAAWGKEDQPDFYNQVVEIESLLSPEELLPRVLQIEKEIGRKRLERWGPRVIDIDILFYNDLVIHSPDLTIPHPQIQNRRFTLVPLNEIAPNLVHPVFKKTVSQLLEECKDPLEVTRLQH